MLFIVVIVIVIVLLSVIALIRFDELGTILQVREIIFNCDYEWLDYLCSDGFFSIVFIILYIYIIIITM